MKKKILSFILTALLPAIAFSAAAQINRYELKVGDFTQLNVVDGINVEYKCNDDSAGLAVYETSRQIADQLIFDSSKKGELKIEKQFHGEGELVYDLPIVRVYSKFLVRAENAGDSTLRVLTVAKVPKFRAKVIGNGTIVVRNIECGEFDGSISTGNGQLVVTGKCDKAILNNTGKGNIQADGLEAKMASCRFFGPGTTGVWAVDELVVKGMFPGKLYYKGTPKKLRNFSMGPKIFPLDDPTAGSLRDPLHGSKVSGTAGKVVTKEETHEAEAHQE